MARLFWNETKTKFVNTFNLLFCRNTEPRDRNRLNNRQAMAIEPTFTEICRKNWYELTKSKIVTKQEFIDKIKKNCEELIKENYEAKYKRLDYLAQSNTVPKYKRLKNGFRYVIWIIVSYAFFEQINLHHVAKDINASMQPGFDHGGLNSNVTI